MVRFLAASLACCLFPIPDLYAQDGKTKLPFDNEKRDATLAAQRKWLTDGMLKAYEKDPKWDADAKLVIEGLTNLETGAFNCRTMSKEVGAAAARAVEAGCKDPLIAYAILRSNSDVPHPWRRNLEVRREARSRIVAALPKSSYPAHRKLFVLLNEGNYFAINFLKDAPEGEKAEVRRILMSALQMLKESIATDERNPFMEMDWYNSAMALILGFTALGDESQKAWETVDKVMAECKEFEFKRMRVKGAWMMNQAWAARGNGTIDKVTEDGYMKFKERLREAGELLDAVWEKEKSPIGMERRMWVEIGLGDGDRKEIEKWFARSISNTRDDYNAAVAMKEWTHPKWHGDEVSLREFATACRDSGRDRDGISLIYFDVFYSLNASRDKETEKDICKDEKFIKEVNTLFIEYFKHNPDDFLNRGRYACFCASSRQFQEARRQFELVENRQVASPHFSVDYQKKMKQFVEDSLKHQEEMKKKKEEDARKKN